MQTPSKSQQMKQWTIADMDNAYDDFAHDKSEIPDYVRAIFERRFEPAELSSALIEKRYGGRVAIYATVNPYLFTIQRKYADTFAGPLAPYVQCDSIDANTLLVHSCPSEHIMIKCEPTMFYVDIFAADTAPITVARDDPRIHLNASAIQIATQMREMHIPCVEKPENGTQALVSRETFMKRLDDALRVRSTGAPDERLRAIIHNAGVISHEGARNEAEMSMTALEASHGNYCVSGGFISKLIDPSYRSDDLQYSDVDIFVYGHNQKDTIDAIIAKLFVPGETFIVVKGSVATIYRTDAIKVQIISSTADTPCKVISEFDFANVMVYWSRETVFANAPCIRAYVTRSCTQRRSTGKDEKRIIKLVRNGFDLRSTAQGIARVRREKIHKFIQERYLNVNINRGMPLYEIQARIAIAENLDDVPIVAIDKPISDQMLLQHAIRGYAVANMNADDWSHIDNAQFAIDVDDTRELKYAGLNARMSIDIIGKFAMPQSTDSTLPPHYALFTFILGEKQAQQLEIAIAAVRAKLCEVANQDLITDITVRDGVTQILVNAMQLWHPTSYVAPTTYMITFKIARKSTSVYRLEMYTKV